MAALVGTRARQWSSASTVPSNAGGLRALLMIPSTYALATWMLAVFAWLVSPFSLDPLSLQTMTVLIFTSLVFVASIALHLDVALRTAPALRPVRIGRLEVAITGLAALIGASGLYLYYVQVQSILGGSGSILDILFSPELVRLRAVGAEVQTVGYQLSYFSWIAFFMGSLILFGQYPRHWKLAALGLVIAMLLANLIFLDRTRPTLLITSAALGVFFNRRAEAVRALRAVAFLLAAPIAIFFTYAATTERYDTRYSIFEPFFLYVNSGFGYLNKLILEASTFDYLPVRSMFWFFKILEAAGGYSDVPDQVLPFIYIPFPTNVGTFLEPFYSDGGLLYVFLLMPVFVLCLDRVALVSLRSGTATGLLVWASVAFSSLLSFFVPRFNSVPVWLFLILHFGLIAFKLLPRTRPLAMPRQAGGRSRSPIRRPAAVATRQGA